MRAKGEGSIFQTENNGKSVWCASQSLVDESGNRRFVRGYGATPAEAIARRSKNLQRRITRGSEKLRASTPSVANYAETYLASLTKQQPSTIRKYRRDFEIHINPHIGEIRLENLTAQRLHDLFYNDLASTGSAAKHHVYKNLSAMLNHAEKFSVLKTNPLKKVDRPDHTSRVSDSDDRWINKRTNIAKGLLKWISNPSNEYYDHYPRILFMLLGLRRAELLGLEWSCVNNLTKKGKASLVIKQQLVRHEKHTGKSGWYLKPWTKAKKPRVIYLPELWRKALLLEKKKARTTEADWSKDLIFITPERKHYSYNEHYELWSEILTAYVNHKRKVPKPLTDDEYFRPHAARHITASLLINENVPLEIAQDILGHSDKAMTLHYTHLMRENRQAAGQNLENALNPEPR